MNILRFFTDPILRAPTIGSILMCVVAALVGVLVFVRKRSLLGEALSHATYPGVTSAIVFAGIFSLESTLPFLVLLGAFVSALIGFFVIDRLEKKIKVPPDAALGAVLALFFGTGVTIASYAQNSYTHFFRHLQTYLYGQAATMTDIHIFIYGALAVIVLLFILIFYKEILTVVFDPQFAQTNAIANQVLNFALLVLIVISLVIGIRCVGVVLMSAMLIAPAAAARQFTDRLSRMFGLAALFGLLSAFFGVYFSVLLSEKIEGHYSVPTGPMIVLIGGSWSLYALFFAPRRGLGSRYFRIAKFRGACIKENLLKTLWRMDQTEQKEMNFKEIASKTGFPSFYLFFLIRNLMKKQELLKKGGCYQLTSIGVKRGAHIVRLHRLWEVYLVNSLGLNVERVHKSAEEMEHILTPELEKKLTELLDNPTQDPHQQPIPMREEVNNVL